MHRYIIGRLLFAIVVVLAASVLVWLLTHWVGDPVKLLLPLDASRDQVEQLRSSLGLDQPLWVQFKAFAAKAVRGDFGDSLWQRRPAMTVAMERLPATIKLVGAAFLVAVILAIPLGVLASIKPGSALDRVTSILALQGVCIPDFWLGLLMMMLFSVKLGWLPTSGIGGFNYLILPALTLSLRPMGRMAQMVRSAMLDQLGEQYVTTARAKGVSELKVVLVHALKNAAISIVTIAGWELGRMLAGYTVVVEWLFTWPGIGMLVIQAIDNWDFPLLQASVILIGVTVSMVNLFVDLSYSFFDPRIRGED
ncbi:MAG: ABC transporter permease [Firmicutes bacterium]|nr:ABC transporter permease [Bacillota bacterium]